MKPPRWPVKKHFPVVAVAILLLTIFGRSAHAQSFTRIHDFTTSSNGAGPAGVLTLSGNVLYGATAGGGAAGNGVIFKMNTDGSGFTNLYVFSAALSNGTNADGVQPNGGLVLSGNTLYGTTVKGGVTGNGTVFRINTDGTGFTNLHNFVYAEGVNPNGDLVLIGNTLYGTTAIGGYVWANTGSIFALNTDGSGFNNLHIFTTLGVDGGAPYSGLIASGNVLYGATTGGGETGFGTVYSILTDGTYSTLHSFPGPSGTPQTEGIYPYSTLVLAGNTLYGTAYQGGNANEGLVFSLTTDGATYTKLHDFTDATTFPNTNSDGVTPQAGLVLSGDTLYGTARSGGTSGYGTLFSVKTNGTSFATLHNMGINDGVHLQGALVLGNNTLYGMAQTGSSAINNGDIFSFTLASVVLPKLTIALNATNIVITWPTNSPGFTLQNTTNLSTTPIWNNNPGSPTITGSNYTVTNITVGPQKFFRLTQ